MGACIEPPADTPEWRIWRSCTSKKRYDKYKIAAYKAAILKRDEGQLLDVYKCKFCKGFHLTTKRVNDDDMHISNAQSVSTRPPLSRVPVPYEQAREVATANEENNIDCSPGTADRKGGALVEEIRLDKDERKAFVGWLLKQGYKKETAWTYSIKVHSFKGARTQYDKWNKTRSMSPVNTKEKDVPPNMARPHVDIPPYHFNPGMRYFIEVKPNGGFVIHTSMPQDSDYERMKEDASKWRQLQEKLAEIK